MTLGMGKRQISNILFLETVLIGICSLAVGLFIGIFGSQLMSILVAKLFEADMSEFQFVFSKSACLKTCVYFGLMYVAVMMLNTISISRYKLIDLLTANKKNEKVRMKNPLVCTFVFIVATAVLGRAYYMVTAGAEYLLSYRKLSVVIVMGAVATFLIFWSLSGLILRLVQSRKNLYLKGSNAFVLRQFHNKINTTLFSMTIICLLLFMTVSILSTALSLNQTLRNEIKEMTPVDISLYKTANLIQNEYTTKVQAEDSKQTICDTLKENGMDMSLLKDVVEVRTYYDDEWCLKDSMGNVLSEYRKVYSNGSEYASEEFVKVSDYNRMARDYGIQEYDLAEDEFIVLCNFDNMKKYRNLALQNGNDTFTLKGKTYHAKYKECQDGYLRMAGSHINEGIILVPDSCSFTNRDGGRYYMAANYNAKTEKEKDEIEEIFTNHEKESKVMNAIEKKEIGLAGTTKKSTLESTKGLTTIITFIALYLGVIFLIASSALLALKELTESSDNKQRYDILRKIGMDERMINQALFRQIGITFLLPLILAIIHSIFGIQFALKLIFAVQVDPKQMLPSIIGTILFFIVIYGGYFLATYTGSKNIIK
jgi:putative ABC transport system permease protein